MTARFAGSRSLDERRRRRLASESDEGESFAERPSRGSRAAAASTSKESRTRRASHFPLRKLFSSRLWKIWGVGLLVLTAGVGVLAGTWAAAERPDVLGPGFTPFFNAETSRVVPYFNSLLLVLTGELALLIWWVRSRSLQDFSGQYRVWAWAAVGCFVAAFCLSTGAHTAWSDTIAWLWLVDFWKKEVWFWMAPAAVWSLISLRFLHKEMRDCRWSLPMLWLAAGCFAALGAWQLAELPEFLAASITAPRPLVEAGLMTAGCYLLFQGLLLHVRHVIYKSVEPPAPRPSRFRIRLPKLGLPRLRRRRREEGSSEGRKSRRARRKVTAARSAGEREKQPRGEDPTARDDSPRSSTKAGAESGQDSRGSASSASGSSVQNAQRSETGGQRPAGDTERVAAATARVAQPAAAGASSHPMDKQSLRGLSKKERRRLRQQWREEHEHDRSR